VINSRKIFAIGANSRNTRPGNRAHLILGILYAGLWTPASAQGRIDFARDVQPILREHCAECHGPAQQMSGLRLDRRSSAMPNRVGANGSRIIPGDSTSSRLYIRVSGTKGGAQMPPPGPLRAEQINAIRQWIDQGADWPDDVSGDRDIAPGDPAAVRIRKALRDGDRREFERALRENAKSLNAAGPGGWTPLMYAALYGDARAVRALLEAGANPNVQNGAGGTALMYSVEDAGKTRVLLKHGAKPDSRSGEGRTALLIAAGITGASSTVKLLLDHGADAGVRLPNGRGVLSLATLDAKTFQVLLDHGVETKPALPLLIASKTGCATCFELFFKIAEPGDLSAGLDVAARSGDVPLMQKLLDKGAKARPNALQSVALSPAALPAGTIRTLIGRGADVNAKVAAGLTLLEFARRQGNLTLVKALTEAGARDESAAPPLLRQRPAESARAAVEKSVPLLQRSDVVFLQKAGCVSCHNNSLTAMTVSAARARGIRVSEQIARDQLRKIAAYLDENSQRGLENIGIPGGIDTVSYILLGMAADGYASDTTTDIWARYLKNLQSADGRWPCLARRPPLEASDIQTTAASIRSLSKYGPPGQRADYDKAVARGVQWLRKAEAATTEDHVFRTLGLIWGGAPRAAIRSAAQDLLALQRPDGGWGQIAPLASDAYATGQALVALHDAGVISAGSPAYRRGVQYLLHSQLEDGSWYVQSRAPAFQPYFDSGFPHGRDQFISAAASNWAAMALLKAIP
jgi:ankyrin repeat protein